ncbi:MAG: phosphoribosylformylglycinamidine cyclo-ligase [Deltaproteobacteria bacterium]|jgi:phosphoribosylformylglycinamidine cyclo-ligase|nr:phosphoribosylformylglycinamidine cyclo-ligase [Deltaproteobacteria bacterium]
MRPARRRTVPDDSHDRGKDALGLGPETEGAGGKEPRDEAGLTYSDAGVDITAGDDAVSLIRPLAESTRLPGVMSGIGGFSGLFDLKALDFDDPLLVSSTDGVGTKLKLAFMADRHDTVGIDLVAMSVNDILVQGAKPLFFLDYLATSRLVPEKVRDIVSGVARGCREAGCALLGGETAEMPGFYAEGEYDLAGFAVGAVDRDRVVDGSRVQPGDVILGIASSGLHSNGYSLVRRIVFDRLGLKIDSPLLDSTVADVLLEPTRIYVKPVLELLGRREFSSAVHGMVHVTGGGFLENIPRAIGKSEWLQPAIFPTSWEVPEIFRFLQEVGGVDELEMFRTFNMGVGFIIIIDPAFSQKAVKLLKGRGLVSWEIGKVSERQTSDKVVFILRQS